MDTAQHEISWIAFGGDRRVAEGEPARVARLTKAFANQNPDTPLLIFDARSSQPVEIDLRGTVEDVLARLPPSGAGTPAADPPPPRGPGRPKLGVVAREITLLPRHWEWLATQRGGASVAIRRLVDDARCDNDPADLRRTAQESAYRFVSAMAGNRARYEDAIRALFAGDEEQFVAFTAGWPDDIRGHARNLAGAAFAVSSAPAGAG